MTRNLTEDGRRMTRNFTETKSFTAIRRFGEQVLRPASVLKRR